VLSHVFGAVDKTSPSFSAHGKTGNFIIIIIINNEKLSTLLPTPRRVASFEFELFCQQ